MSLSLPSTPHRVLIEHSEYWLRNHGDMAMLTVTVARLRRRWPDADIAVMTDSPALLRAFLPEVRPITVTGSAGWDRLPPAARAATRLPATVVGPLALSRLTALARARGWAATTAHRTRMVTALARGELHRLLMQPPPPPPSLPPPPVRAAIARATLVLGLGGGYLTDVDTAQSHRVLTVLGYAADRGIPTALVGQGLGPMTGLELRRHAARVLPRLGFLGLREDRRGPRLAAELGVPADQILVTGDDAVALAYRARTGLLGDRLGLCLRTTDYTGVSAETAAALGSVVRAHAATHRAPLAPLPIAEYRSQDRRATLPLTRGHHPTKRPPGRYAPPAEVVGRVSQCRVVVTGAYHLAVFALGQGIPVVAVTSTDYYDDKFYGLAQIFGTGLEVVSLTEPDAPAMLGAAIDRAWDRAPGVRAELLTAAQRQITLSETGLDRICALADTARTERIPAP